REAASLQGNFPDLRESTQGSCDLRKHRTGKIVGTFPEGCPEPHTRPPGQECVGFPDGLVGGMSVETWRPVVGYQGLYGVSDLGRVRTLGRVDTRGRRRAARLMKPSRNSLGHIQVRLTPRPVDGRAQRPVTCRVAVLVLEAFVGPRPP